MPCYFFEIRDGDDAHLDNGGFEFANLKEAVEEAVRAATEMMKDAVPDGDHRVIGVEIRDEGGQPLGRAQVSLNVELLPPARQHRS